MGIPRIWSFDKGDDIGAKDACHKISQRDVFKNLAIGGSSRNPNIGEVGRSPRIFHILWTVAVDIEEVARLGAHHVGNADVGRAAR